jgi:hypothetical protein
MTDRPEVCPECRAGKHGNCPGWALDEVNDELIDCPCDHDGAWTS